MDVILSHDVDHITAWEHWKDLIVPKALVRSKIEWLKGTISFKEVLRRYGDVVSGQWQHIEDVMRADERVGARSCFFFGVANGLGLSYSQRHVAAWVPRVLSAGFEAGVHGIAYADATAVQHERDAFIALTGHAPAGIRMHYLRHDVRTLEHVAAAGYTFDATMSGLSDPYRISGLWEFPIQEMDVWALCSGARYQARRMEEAVAHTLARVEEAERAGSRYFSLLFHDSYYTPAFASWKGWYDRVIGALAERGHRFVGYQEAMVRLSGTISVRS